MSEGSQGPPGEAPASEEASDRGLGIPRAALIIMIPGILAPVVILGFILRTELAHDEGSCPFEGLSSQELAEGVVVREERRRCLPDVEEHRFVIHRPGLPAHVLGARRFAPTAFGSGYRWQANSSEQGEISVEVQNPGHPNRVLREGTAEDEEAWSK